MVKYYGRARTRTGSVNTNQLGLKMSGCPSTVGKQGRIARYMGRRVDCMMGLCKPIRYHEVIWPRTRMRNQPPFCRAHATKCLAAAGGVGTNHNIPYYRIPAAGESGCTPAPVVTGSVFQLMFETSGDGSMVGYFMADPSIPGFGSISPGQYKGVVVTQVVVEKVGSVPQKSAFQVIFSNSVPLFDTITLKGHGVNFTFHRSNALIGDVGTQGKAVAWCYPSGTTPNETPPIGCSVFPLPSPGAYTLTIS